MLSINNIFEVHSIKKFIKKHKIKKITACVDDGERNFKQQGYKFHNLFFVVTPFVIDLYVYDDGDDWIVR